MTTIVVVWAIVLALLLLIGARSVRTVRRSLRCPLMGIDVCVAALEALPEGRPMDVATCSAFTPATAITCGKPCLGELSRSASKANADRAAS